MSTDPSRFTALDRHQAGVVLFGFGLGLGLSLYHFGGLVVGGVLLGIGARDIRRAFVLSALFGLTVWASFAGSLFLQGRLSAYTATGELALLSGTIAVGLPLLGAMARGLR